LEIHGGDQEKTNYQVLVKFETLAISPGNKTSECTLQKWWCGGN